MVDDIQSGAGAAPTVDAGAGSPAPSETSAAPEKTSLFQTLMAEGEDAGEDPAEEAETDVDGQDAAPGETPEAEGAEEPQPEEGPTADEEVPKDLRAVLKKFPELRAAHFYKRDLDALGISVDEAQEYRQSIQSLEDLRSTVDRAQQLEAFEGLFTHPDPEAPVRFLEGLRLVDDAAATRFVRSLAKRLPELAPDAYYELGGRAWEVGLKNLEVIAGDDPFRREALAAVREMVEEAAKAPSSRPQPPQKLANPEADELAARRAHEDRARNEYWTGMRNEANRSADAAVREIVADIEKRRDPDGILLTPDLREKIVHEIHTTIAGVWAVNDRFVRTLHDVSIPPAQRIAKAAALVQSRAKNVADLVFKRNTDGLAERLRKVSQQRLGKAAKVVSMREATGGRPASTPAAPLPRGARVTSRDIFRAVMKG